MTPEPVVDPRWMKLHGLRGSLAAHGMLVAAFAGTFVALLDLSVVNVALPSIQADLHAEVAGAQWVVDGYSLPLAALMLSGGSLVDRYGRKRLFLAALAVFLGGSVICAAAHTLGVMIFGRALQGAAAAVVVPGALSLLAQAEASHERRARLMGYWAMSASTAIVVGPLLGGALVATLGWPWIFLVNLPIGIAAIAIGARTIIESADPEHAALDGVGQVLAIVSLATLSYTVIEGRGHGWGSPTTVGLLIVAAVAAAAFIAVELRQPRPMLPVRLLADRGFGSVNVASIALGFGANGAFFLLSLYLQQGRGHSALATGALLLPMTVALVPMSAVAGRLTARHGARRPMVLGYALTGLALGAMAIGLGSGTSYALIAFLFLVAGVGQGLAITPAATAVLQRVPRQRSGVAAATVSTARQVGTALGIAALGAILAAHTDDGYAGAPREAFASGTRAALGVAATVVLLAAGLLAALLPSQSAARQQR